MLRGDEFNHSKKWREEENAKKDLISMLIRKTNRILFKSPHCLIGKI
jgi:hypothetical protein